MIAIGAVASTTVAQARRDGETTRVISVRFSDSPYLRAFAVARSGVSFRFPRGDMAHGRRRVATLIGAGVLWYIACRSVPICS